MSESTDVVEVKISLNPEKFMDNFLNFVSIRIVDENAIGKVSTSEVANKIEMLVMDTLYNLSKLIADPEDHQKGYKEMLCSKILVDSDMHKLLEDNEVNKSVLKTIRLTLEDRKKKLG